MIKWVNANNEVDALIKAAIAAIVHLWLVTTHPYADGNGRLCRTLTEMKLARADGMAQRYYSLSPSILNNSMGYYEMQERTQKGNTDITEWVEWFLRTLYQAVTASIGKMGRGYSRGSGTQQLAAI